MRNGSKARVQATESIVWLWADVWRTEWSNNTAPTFYHLDMYRLYTLRNSSDCLLNISPTDVSHETFTARDEWQCLLNTSKIL